jgi:hypothetical protein
VRVAPDGSVDARGAPGGEGSTTFFAQPCADGSLRLATLAGGGAYLAVGAPPGLRVEVVPSAERATAVRVVPARGGGARGSSASGPEAWPAAPPLSAAEKGAFVRDGYLVLRGAAGPLAVAAALRHLNSVVGELARGAAPTEEAREALLHTEHPAALGLLTRTRVGGFAARLCSKLRAPARAQLAPRYPQPLPPAAAARAFATDAGGGGGGAPADDPLAALGEKRSQGPSSRWHVDGVDAARREPPARANLAPFSLLVGVALSDTPHAAAGQFTVFPGSHLQLAALVAEKGEGALLSGERPALNAAPVELRLAAGDAVFAHPLLAHRVGVNFSAAIRAAVFFRLHHREHAHLRTALLSGAPWAELDAVAEQGA